MVCPLYTHIYIWWVSQIYVNIYTYSNLELHVRVLTACIRHIFKLKCIICNKDKSSFAILKSLHLPVMHKSGRMVWISYRKKKRKHYQCSNKRKETVSITVLTPFQMSRCNTASELQVIIYATYGAIVRYSRVNEVQFLQPLTVQVEKQGSIIMISHGDACQSRGEENL